MITRSDQHQIVQMTIQNAARKEFYKDDMALFRIEVGENHFNLIFSSTIEHVKIKIIF